MISSHLIIRSAGVVGVCVLACMRACERERDIEGEITKLVFVYMRFTPKYMSV